MKKRLAKAISDFSYCSRRDAEKLITSGKVFVNGKNIIDVVTFVEDSDQIIVEGNELKVNKTKLFIYNKPRGEVVSHNDPEGRTTIFSQFDKSLGYLISVGRLDLDSEGLILITNSGTLARKYELPENEFERIYEVKAYGKLDLRNMKRLEKGAKIDGIKYLPCKVKYLRSNGANHFFEVILKEGKNREIRKMFEYIDMQVSRLKRLTFGQYKLGNINKGELREVKPV